MYSELFFCFFFVFGWKLTSFCPFYCFLGILEGTEFFIVYQLFDDVVEALLQLIESSETSEAVSRWFVLTSEFKVQIGHRKEF